MDDTNQNQDYLKFSRVVPEITFRPADDESDSFVITLEELDLLAKRRFAEGQIDSLNRLSAFAEFEPTIRNKIEEQKNNYSAERTEYTNSLLNLYKHTVDEQ